MSAFFSRWLQYLLPLILLVYLLMGWLFRQQIFGVADAPNKVQPDAKVVEALPQFAGGVAAFSSDTQTVPQASVSPYHFRSVQDSEWEEDQDMLNLLLPARQQVASGQVGQAEATFRNIIARYPQRPDAYGELGNLYLSQGRHGDAAEAYLSAGFRLRLPAQQGRYEDLMRVLQQLAPEKAASLHQYHAQGNAPLSNRLQ